MKIHSEAGIAVGTPADHSDQGKCVVMGIDGSFYHLILPLLKLPGISLCYIFFQIECQGFPKNFKNDMEN